MFMIDSKTSHRNAKPRPRLFIYTSYLTQAASYSERESTTTKFVISQNRVITHDRVYHTRSLGECKPHHYANPQKHKLSKLRPEPANNFSTSLDDKHAPIIRIDDDVARLKEPVRAPRAHKCRCRRRIVIRENCVHY